MDITKVMKSLTKLYGKKIMKPFEGKKGWDAYNIAYRSSQVLAANMTDDDYLAETDATSYRVLYKTIMTAWEKVLQSKDTEYDFPEFPEFKKDDDLHTISGRVDTWAAKM